MSYIKVELEDFLSQEECDLLIEIGHKLGYEKPKIKTPEGTVVREDFRNNGSAVSIMK